MNLIDLKLGNCSVAVITDFTRNIRANLSRNKQEQIHKRQSIVQRLGLARFQFLMNEEMLHAHLKYQLEQLKKPFGRCLTASELQYQLLAAITRLNRLCLKTEY